ncbi:MAG: hypothetical protein RLZZ164_784 [Actinomycetota bacterium]|jgi:hypothetical protein
MSKHFVLADEQSARDLQSFLSRAKRLDPEGLVRLSAFGRLLAAYVAPIFAVGLMDESPTVIGMRTSELTKDAEIETMVPISAVLDRLARVLDSGATEYLIELPESSARAAWAGISAPRSGWQEVGSITEAELTELARAGIKEVQDTLPTSVGGPIAARIRGEIWGRGVAQYTKVPTGAAFVIAGLGFLTEHEVVPIYEADRWVRLSSEFGHVLARAANKVV